MSVALQSGDAVRFLPVPACAGAVVSRVQLAREARQDASKGGGPNFETRWPLVERVAGHDPCLANFQGRNMSRIASSSAIVGTCRVFRGALRRRCA